MIQAIADLGLFAVSIALLLGGTALALHGLRRLWRERAEMNIRVERERTEPIQLGRWSKHD